MSFLIQCDFDGTITTENADVRLLEAFAGEGWQRYVEDYRQGLLSVERQNKASHTYLRGDRETYTCFVREQIQMREGFPELVAFCRQRGLPLVIVSVGCDYYIEALLDKFGLKGLPVYCAKTRFTPAGVLVDYFSPDGGHLLEAGFKRTHAELFRRRGHEIIYIGDGQSDCDAASLASHIFARGDLLEHCRRRGLPYHRYENFRDVLAVLEAIPLQP